MRRQFYVVLIKPSKYDDDGYVISWRRAAIPSNTLACLYSLTEDARERRVLGDVKLVIEAYDESNCQLPVKRLIHRIKGAGGHGLVCLVGVQTNQFPRALDLARQFQSAGIQTAIGGFHISGCLAMLPEPPQDLKDAMAAGTTLYAGEIEGRWDAILKAAYDGRLQPLYNFLDDRPALGGQPMPILPQRLVQRYFGTLASFDAGRGCPFECSFCTIINVQGRKPRGRSANDVERVVRRNYTRGVHRYFITDDDFARHRNWEMIFDRLIKLREEEGLKISFTIQVDAASYRLPRFIEKAARAGCTKVFIGLESMNPETLKDTGKRQNRVEEYRQMLLAWRKNHVITCAGYILGFPSDTYESVVRDIETIKRELPIDLLEFFVLTPLPGSEDHKRLHARGVGMDKDWNKYDTEHVVLAHPRMSKEEWERAYRDAWRSYYSLDHIQTLLRHAGASGLPLGKLLGQIFAFYGSITYERVHPLQSGIWRRKDRTSRRPGLPIESRFVFYPRRAWELTRTACCAMWFAMKLQKIRRRVERSPDFRTYSDAALEPCGTKKEAITDVKEPTAVSGSHPFRGKIAVASSELTWRYRHNQ